MKFYSVFTLVTCAELLVKYFGCRIRTWRPPDVERTSHRLELALNVMQPPAMDFGQTRPYAEALNIIGNASIIIINVNW